MPLPASFEPGRAMSYGETTELGRKRLPDA